MLNQKILVKVEKPITNGLMLAKNLEPNNPVVFVANALPDEILEVEINEVKKSYWNASIVRIIEANPKRIDFKCKAAEVGSGCCSYSNTDIEYSRDLKNILIADTFNRISKIDQINNKELEKIESIDDSESNWRIRTRYITDENANPGTYTFKTHNESTSVLCNQPVNEILNKIQELALPKNSHVSIHSDSNKNQHVHSWNLNEKNLKPNLLYGELNAEQIIEINNQTLNLKTPSHSFWQPHQSAAQTYAQLVYFWLKKLDFKIQNIWDLYCGSGLLTVASAKYFEDLKIDSSTINSIDNSKLSVDLIKENTKTWMDDTHIFSIVDSVPDIFGIKGNKTRSHLQKFKPQVIITDPPRSGLGEKLIKELIKTEVKAIIHFGCDLASTARDIGIFLEQGFKIKEYKFFDAFPFTWHCESAFLFVK